MKKLLIVLGSFVLILSLSFSFIFYSNKAFPGSSLYSVDRGMENIQLSISQTLGKVNYAYTNLSLAKERLEEISQYNRSKVTTSSLVFKVNAQSTDTVDEVSALLLEEFNGNLKEVLTAFNQLKETDQVKALELAKEISMNTSDFGTSLANLMYDFNQVETDMVNVSSDLLEELDDDAVEKLVEESDNSDDEDLKKASLEKVTKKILKAGEKLTDLKDKYDDKNEDKKLTQEQITEVGLKIDQIQH